MLFPRAPSYIPIVCSISVLSTGRSALKKIALSETWSRLAYEETHVLDERIAVFVLVLFPLCVVRNAVIVPTHGSSIGFSF